MGLVQGSDAHPQSEYQPRFTWMYLPEVTPQSLRHALATYEASISIDEEPPAEPEFWIKSLRFEGGPYDGRRVEFSPRANALIGPPSSGKSLIVDAISFAFGMQCAMDDVQASVQNRLAKCLPDGTTVALEVMDHEGRQDVQRIMGGTTISERESKPIVFSQTELARRAMEPVPAVELLDIHCPESEIHKKEIEKASADAISTFTDIVDLATQAGSLRLEVENDQEGLEMTRAKYFQLVGDETTAKALGDLARLENWHRQADQGLATWRAGLTIPAGPELPAAPQLETGRNVGDYVPTEMIQGAIEEYRKGVGEASDGLVEYLRSELVKGNTNVAELRSTVEKSLGDEHDAIPEVAEQARSYRERLSELEQQARQIERLDQQIAQNLEALDAIVDRASNAWGDLREARKRACSNVNASMPSFFVRLSRGSLTAHIDEVVDELRVGTRLHEASARAARDALDRKAFVRAAVARKQFPATSHDDEEADDPSGDARKIARVAVDREKHRDIARLSVLWPGDGIEILQKQTGADPVPFDNLTEGLKALAIKEISFAASQLPAVSDQPEDAVPTTAVFENLVPTIREQRRSRQFIIASHDANIVVSGDMDRVIVLPPHPSQHPVEGTLFDKPIRERAIALLEGGDRAFELRRRRYGDYD